MNSMSADIFRISSMSDHIRHGNDQKCADHRLNDLTQATPAAERQRNAHAGGRDIKGLLVIVVGVPFAQDAPGPIRGETGSPALDVDEHDSVWAWCDEADFVVPLPSRFSPQHIPQCPRRFPPERIPGRRTDVLSAKGGEEGGRPQVFFPTSLAPRRSGAGAGPTLRVADRQVVGARGVQRRRPATQPRTASSSSCGSSGRRSSGGRRSGSAG